MSTEADRPRTFVNPRPGVVKTLGVLNILFAVILFVLSLTYIPFLIFNARNPMVAVVEVVHGQPAPNVPSAAQPVPMMARDPMMGMSDPSFVKFMYVDLSTSLIINGLMFATGLGLLNLKRWGSRGWFWLAWFKIVRLIVLYGVFIIAVGPSLSSSAAKSVAAMVPTRPGSAQAPPVVQLTHFYNVMFAIFGVGMMGFGAIYPAISLWVLGKPGVQAALVGKTPSQETIDP